MTLQEDLATAYRVDFACDCEDFLVSDRAGELIQLDNPRQEIRSAYLFDFYGTDTRVGIIDVLKTHRVTVWGDDDNIGWLAFAFWQYLLRGLTAPVDVGWGRLLPGDWRSGAWEPTGSEVYAFMRDVHRLCCSYRVFDPGPDPESLLPPGSIEHVIMRRRHSPESASAQERSGPTLPDRSLARFIRFLRLCDTTYRNRVGLPTKASEIMPDFSQCPQLGKMIKGCLEARGIRPETSHRHSTGFRSVIWHGQPYDFSATQASAVEQWWKAYENGTPDIGDERLLEMIGSGSDYTRVRDLFRGHPAWNVMIVSGSTKGTHRLAAPPNS